MTLADTCRDASASLNATRAAKGLWASTRADQLQHWRTGVAIALAEAKTGVTHNEARLANVYPRKSLTQTQINNALLYRKALAESYLELPETYAELLTVLDSLAGQGQAAA